MLSKIYQQLLEYLAQLRAENNIWTALPKEVAGWWRQRSQMELVNESGRWCVKGLGSERACLAYATLDGETVTYTVAD